MSCFPSDQDDSLWIWISCLHRWGSLQWPRYLPDYDAEWVLSGRRKAHLPSLLWRWWLTGSHGWGAYSATCIRPSAFWCMSYGDGLKVMGLELGLETCMARELCQKYVIRSTSLCTQATYYGSSKLGLYLCIGYISLHWVYIVKYGKVVGLPDGHYT